MSNMKIALRMIVVMTIITGVAYPILVTVLAQVLFSDKANGSLIVQDGRTVGSALVGQKFATDGYFWSRPSAVDYNPMPSGGSNLGPTSKTLADAVHDRRSALFAKSGNSFEPPADLLLASGSGLDPHISPEAAQYQVGRIVAARQLDPTQQNTLLSLIAVHTEQRTFGLLGEPTVNVLKINMALDSVFSRDH